ncbi:MAG: hypothetical protein QNJ91_12525 [Gammaproteobacteria bacterium]|nr:hypothetical protein [Gammaproteobacteria bacterium]
MSAEGEATLSKAIKSADRDKCMGRQPGEVTLMHRVRPGQETVVAALLDSAQFCDRVRHLEGVHFLRLFAIDGGTRLVFCGDFDAPPEDRFARLCLRYQMQLDELWSHCTGFPAGGIADLQAFSAFVATGLQPCGFRYSAFPQVTVRQIQKALDWKRKTVSFQIELAKKPKSI